MLNVFFIVRESKPVIRLPHFGFEVTSVGPLLRILETAAGTLAARYDNSFIRVWIDSFTQK